MVILGNATLFAENSPMWRSVIQTLQAEDAVAESLPIRCEQHPEEISFVKEPGIISQLSPQGSLIVPRMPARPALTCSTFSTFFRWLP